MSAKSPLPRVFGPYILTHHFGDDRLGSSYRAGTASGPRLSPFLLLRVFSGEKLDRSKLLPVLEVAVDYLEEVRGPAVAKGAVLGIVDDVPFAGIEYVPGRTLDRLFAGDGGETVALPIEHALLMGEKLLIALEAAKPFERKMGAPHGFLVPSFVTVSNDGDVRVFGSGIGSGLLPAVTDPGVHSAFAPYLAPEVLASGKPSVAGDIYSTAAILFEGLTGRPPVPGRGESALDGALLAINGSPIPDDVARLLAKGLATSPAQREGDVVAYRKQLGKLLYAGPYAPSTFNLAFFMHQKFEKAIERERKSLAQEEELDAKPLLLAEEEREKVRAARAAAPRREPELPRLSLDTSVTSGGTPKKKGGGALVPIALGVVVAAAVGGWFLLKGGAKQEAAAPAAAVAPAPTATPAPPPTPIIVGKEDPEFQKALQAKLAEEMKKVTDQIGKEQAAAAKKREAELAKVEEEARKAREAEEAARKARDRADAEEAARLAREAEAARQREEAARKAAEAAAPKTRDGDLVEIGTVDRPPQATKIVKPEASLLARQRKIGGTVLLRVLVDESGNPAQVEILRDTSPAVGLGETSRTAVQQWTWQPAMKDGKRVKVWIVVPIPFTIK